MGQNWQVTKLGEFYDYIVNKNQTESWMASKVPTPTTDANVVKTKLEDVFSSL